jgi:hypothetical protein
MSDKHDIAVKARTINSVWSQNLVVTEKPLSLDSQKSRDAGNRSSQTNFNQITFIPMETKKKSKFFSISYTCS